MSSSILSDYDCLICVVVLLAELLAENQGGVGNFLGFGGFLKFYNFLIFNYYKYWFVEKFNVNACKYYKYSIDNNSLLI